MTERRLRVLLVTNMYPPHHYGGYELSCRDVVLRWRRRGHRVTVLTSQVEVPGVTEVRSSDDVDEDVDVRRELDLYWDDHRLVRPGFVGCWRIERRNQARLRDALRDSAPDVVSIWNMGAASLGLVTAAVESGLPVVYVVCNNWLDFGRDLDPWTSRWAARARLARAARRVLRVPTVLPDLGSTGAWCFVSEATRRWAEEHTLWRFPRSEVVHSGIEPNDFGFAEGGHDRGWRWRLLYVGRIDVEKGVDTAVRALAELPAEARLTLVGRGNPAEIERLHELIGELGLRDRVAFTACERHEVAAHYREADVVVFPSTWEEPFGLVPLEAMACGTPVVATMTGGSAEYLADGVNCLAFARHDHRALAEAVRRLAGDGELRSRLVDAGLTTVGRFTVDGLAARLEAAHLAEVDAVRGPGIPRPSVAEPL